jgi:tetratricopeptide (TPR) repeat protein
MAPFSLITARRLRHAEGYLGLGMLTEARHELGAIDAEARHSHEARVLRSDLHLQAKDWNELVAEAQAMARQDPAYEKAWIDWAYALRELNRIAEAKAVLMEAEPRHGKESGVLHYNLACYHCLLGEMPEARARLDRADALDRDWKKFAREDTDLAALWAELRGE